MPAPHSLDKLDGRRIKAVFSDLDDTITTDGRVTSETFHTLWELKARGFWIVIVSGRPAGWADCLMRLWPIDHFIFENGAAYIERQGSKLNTVALHGAVSDGALRTRLAEAFQAVKAKLPHAKLASDQSFRRYDYAIDVREEPPFLSDEQIGVAMKILASQPGVTSKLSSIHINYWLGNYTKVTAVEHLLKTNNGYPGITTQQIVFCGDSPNDEPLFGFFPLSVGVDNVTPYISGMKTGPKFLAGEKSGNGFQRLCQHLLKATS